MSAPLFLCLLNVIQQPFNHKILASLIPLLNKKEGFYQTN